MSRAVRIILAIVVLLGFAMGGQHWSRTHAVQEEGTVVDALGEAIPSVSPALIDTGAGVGLLLLGSWLLGRLLAPMGLPKVMGYLIFGVVCGPGILGIVSSSEMEYLVLVNDLAIALIALLAGAEIRVDFLRRSLRAVSLITVIEMAAVLVGVTAASMFVVPRLGLVEGMLPVFLVSLLIGTVLITNSPAVLLAVITELRCRGSMTQISLAVTVCKDLSLVVLFTIVLAIVGTSLKGMYGAGGAGETVGAREQTVVQPGDEASVGVESRPGAAGEEVGADGTSKAPEKTPPLALYLIQHLGGSIGAGLVVGLAMAWYLHRIDAHLPIFLVFACFGIALMSEALHLEPLIVAVVAGMLMENVWGERLEGFFETVEETSTPVYCVFFAVTGAKVDLGQVGALWHWALALVLIRLVMVWAGTTLAARLAGVEKGTRRWLWTAFVPQAGISMALLLIVESTLKGLPMADGLFTLLVGVIGLNLMLGPLVLSMGLRASGEAGAADAPASGEEAEGER